MNVTESLTTDQGYSAEIASAVLSHLKIIVGYLLGCLAALSQDVFHLLLFFLSIIFLNVLMCFFKCLPSRYRMIITEQDGQIEPSKRSPRSFGRAKVGSQRYRHLVSEILRKMIDDHEHLDRICRLSPTAQSLRSICAMMPWNHTRQDIETVAWLNQSLRTFWPTIKTSIYAALFNRMGDSSGEWTMPESRNLAKKRAKLSFLISGRRKLSHLQRNISRSLTGHNLINTLLDAIKIFFVHLKQFVIDSVIAQFNGGSKSNTPRKQLNIKDVISGSNLRVKVPRSWGGRSSEKSSVKVDKKFKSAPVKLYIRKTGASQPETSRREDKFRRKRLNLAKFLEKRACVKSSKKKAITLNLVKLGRFPPKISGIKCLSDAHSTSTDDNMKFITELTFRSGIDFRILFDSVPIVGKLELRKLSINLRLMLTLDHSAFPHGNNDVLKSQLILPQPDYIQVALVDVPRIDWLLESPRSGGKLDKRLAVTQYLIRIANHSYFKYIAHNILYLVLRWFDSFDIKVGPRIYIRSLSRSVFEKW